VVKPQVELTSQEQRFADDVGDMVTGAIQAAVEKVARKVGSEARESAEQILKLENALRREQRENGRLRRLVAKMEKRA
jgi:hypothetical protein